MLDGDADYYRDTIMAQRGLPNVKEVYIDSDEICSDEGLFARVCLPELEMIRCGWPCTPHGKPDEDDFLVLFLRHSRNVPALQSILWTGSGRAMKTSIPAFLAGIHEIMLATDQPLALAFDNPCSAGEALNTFCVVASEVSIDAAALLAMTDALIRRGLTLSMAQAGPEHEHAPSQCLYIRAVSAPQLSYDEAVQFVSKRVGTWARHHRCVCGACFECLRRAGVLN